MITNIVIVLLMAALIRGLPQRAAAPTDVPHYTKLSSDHLNHLQNHGFGPTVPSVYALASTINDAEDTETAATQEKATYGDYPNYPNAIPIKQLQRQNLDDQPQLIVQRLSRPNYPISASRPAPQQFQRSEQRAEQRNQQRIEKEKAKEEEEAEINEPDRLSLLLPQSKFTCVGKNTGYYADEDLACEVFHYCQDNAKHSWICPEGFTFHQVHLICMPPSKDNNCATSSQFHFVNEYLYKPINLEEYQQKPNTSLRYSERYYPESYNREDEEQQEQVVRPKHSQRVYNHQLQPQQQQQLPIPKNLLVVEPITRTTFRPETNIGQVFRSPNEVNIPLQQRRPIYAQQRYVRDEENEY